MTWRDYLNERLASAHMCMKHSGPCNECDLRAAVRLLMQERADLEREKLRAIDALAEKAVSRAEMFEFAEEYRNNWKQAEDKVDQLREALEELVAYQNGSPLPSYDEGWANAMRLACAALRGGGK